MLQGTMAQLTQLARNRGCELEWVANVTITLPSNQGSDDRHSSVVDTGYSYPPSSPSSHSAPAPANKANGAIVASVASSSSSSSSSSCSSSSSSSTAHYHSSDPAHGIDCGPSHGRSPNPEPCTTLDLSSSSDPGLNPDPSSTPDAATTPGPATNPEPSSSYDPGPTPDAAPSPGPTPIPEPSATSNYAPNPDPSPSGDGACPSEPPTFSSLRHLLQTTTHLHCFHLHLPPAARAAGKGLPTLRRAVDRNREQASDPHSADLYAKPLEAEQVMQVLRRVQLQLGQEVQVRVYQRSIEELQSHPELEGLLEAKDLHMQAYCDSHVVVATHPLPNYRPQLDPIWSKAVPLWMHDYALAAAQLDSPWPDPLTPYASQLTAGVQLGDQQVPQQDRGSLYPGPSPATAARWASVVRMLKGAAHCENLGEATTASRGPAQSHAAALTKTTEPGREKRNTRSSSGHEKGEWWGNSAGDHSGGGATARFALAAEYGYSNDEDHATASLRDLGAYKSLQQGRAQHLRAVLAAKRQQKSKHGPRATRRWQRKLNETLKKQQAANQWLPHVQAIQVQRQALPIHASKQQLLEAIERNPVTIVSGETGSGKSTQLPQFLLEEAVAAGRGAAVSLVVTQPRRISTISLARRVAEERGEALGDAVGYKVRLDSCVSSNTRLTYMTSGLLLRRLLIDPDLEDTTHVFIDEVHERHTNTDFTLIALKRLLTRRPGFKIVLMSATLQAQRFATYFGSAASCFAFPGRTFPVQQFYLEDFLQESGITPFTDDELREANIELSSLVRRLAEEEQLKQQAATPGQEGSSIPSLADLYGWAGGEQQSQLQVQASDDAIEGQQAEGQEVEIQLAEGRQVKGQQVQGQQTEVCKNQLGEGVHGGGRQERQHRHQQRKQKERVQRPKGRPDHEPWQEEELEVEPLGWHCGFDLGLAAKAHVQEKRRLSRRVLLGLKAWLEQRDGKVDLFLAAAVVRHLHATQPPGGAILVLLPGWQDIEWLRALLTCGPKTWGKLFGSRQQQDGGSISSGSYGDNGDAGRQSAQTGEVPRPDAQGQASPQPVEGMWVLPCHSSLTREEQQMVFDSAPQGSRKVVLATNIAETSITIPDVTAVVDSGRRRQVGYDPLNKTKSLTQGWISQSSAEQRKGRAGRVQPGVCYRLYPRLFWQHHMALHDVPEVQRMPLEEVCLQILNMEMGDPAAFLAEALDPPEALAVENALTLLQNIGAIQPTTAPTDQQLQAESKQRRHQAGNQELSVAAEGDPAPFSFTEEPSEWQLTQLGHALAALPLDPRLGKMLILGATFGCLAPMLTLAAHSMGNPAWLRVPRWPALEEEVQETRRRLGAVGGDANSDHMAIDAGWALWYRLRRRGAEFVCQPAYLSTKQLQYMQQTRLQLAEQLMELGLIASSDACWDAAVRRANPHMQQWPGSLAATFPPPGAEGERGWKAGFGARSQWQQGSKAWEEGGDWAGGWAGSHTLGWKGQGRGRGVGKSVAQRQQAVTPELLAEVAWQASGRQQRWAVEAAIQEHSWAAGDAELVKGLLVAGLASQLARVQLIDTQKSRQGSVSQRMGKDLKVEGKYMLRLFTTDEGQVLLPNNLSSSLLARPQDWIIKGPQPRNKGWLPPPWLPHRWLVYSDKTKIDDMVVPSSLSSVTDMALLLFGNELELEEGERKRGLVYCKPRVEGTKARTEQPAGMVWLSMQHSFISWRLKSAHAQAVLRIRRAMAHLLQRHLQEPSLLLRDEAYQLTARLQHLLAHAAAKPKFIQGLDVHKSRQGQKQKQIYVAK
ncbi:hypothetical protein V8C86DRAFT_1468919 [Haematococcus lacustris]